MEYPGIGQIVREAPELDELLAPDVRIEVLTSGYVWSEGPVWVPEGEFLLFSDIPRNSIFRWKEGEGCSLYLRPSGYTGLEPYSYEPGSNGLTLDPQGRLVLCEHGDRRVSRLERGGGRKTLVDSYEGRRLNSPNDCVYTSDGALYFTDPPYGLPSQDSPLRELDYCGVYRLSPAGELTLLTQELSRPNGLAFSPDERTLYVANSDPRHAIWMAYPVQEDGLLGEGRVFADVTGMIGVEHPGLPDGMKVDRNGYLFATGPGGVHVYRPDGKRLGRISTGDKISNCNWGEDGSVLYMTCNHDVCRVRTRTRGAGWMRDA